MKVLSVLVAVCGLLMVAPPTFAGNDSGGYAAMVLSDRTTNRIVKRLQSDFQDCTRHPKVYRYDCYQKSYASAASALRGSDDYAKAAEALRLVQQRIKAVVDANLDPAQKPLRKGLQRFRPVQQAALPQLKRETIRAMDQARTILLRSPSAAQKPHFQKIAAAIDSNKVLLRSALLHLHPLIRTAALVFGWDHPARHL